MRKMWIAFLCLTVFVFLPGVIFCQQTLYARASGSWSAGTTWSTDGITSCSCTPTLADDVFTNGFLISVPTGSFSVNNLFISSSQSGSLFKSGLSSATITIFGELGSYSGSIGNENLTLPTSAIITITRLNFVFNGTNPAGTSIIETGGWGPLAPLPSFSFNPVTPGTPLSIDAGVAIGSGATMTITTGTLNINAILQSATSSATITVNPGATLVFNSGSLTGSSGDNTTSFPTLTVNGTLTSANNTTSFVNAATINLNSGSVFNVGYNGSNQTQGWWYQSTSPSSQTIDPASTVNFNSSTSQNVFAQSYGNLTLSGSSTTKTVSGAGSVNLKGNLSFSNTSVTFVAPSSNQVIFDGTTTIPQTISGGGTANFNGGLQLNKSSGTNTTLVLSQNISIQNGLTLTSGILIFGSQTINLSGNLDNNATLTPSSSTLNITGTTSVTGSSTTSLNNLTISGTGNFTAPSTLNIAGNFTNNGTFNSSTSTLVFNGSALQTIGGTSVSTFNNLSITNTTLGTSVEVISNQNLKSVLSLAAGSTFDADGASNASVFTLLSSADNTTIDASIAALPSGASVSGNVTVQRFMSIEGPNNTRIYRYISSPVQNAQALDIQNEIPITGAFTGSSSCSGCGTNQSMFSYNEAVITGGIDGGYVNFPAATITETLIPGLGYAIYERGNVIPSGLWDVRGPINSGNVILGGASGVTFTSSGVPADDGWNLVGNPYPSTIDWNASGWTKTNLNGTIYMRDNATGTIASFNGVSGTNGGSRYIATGQAFFVQASSASPSLVVSETAKAAGTQTTFFREEAPTNLIRVTMKKDAVSDELVVHFRKDASSEFDAQMDARKLKNATFNFSSVTADNSKLAINSLPLLGCSSEVKLDVSDALSGGYQLSFSEFESFPAGVKISLLDKISNTTQDIRANSSYSFSVDQNNASTFGSDRFVLQFSYVSASIEMNSVEACLGSDVSLTLKNSQPDLTYTFLSNGVQFVDAVNGSGGDVNLKIPNTKLKEGINTIDVRAISSTCASISASTSIQVRSVSAPNVNSIITTNGQSCREGSVVLNALGAPTNGSYRWYDSKDSPYAIINAVLASYVTPALNGTKSYYVSVLSALGCESDRKEIVAEVVKYPDAIIQQLDNTTLSSNFAKGNQWYKDGKLIDGATSQQLKIDDTGNYKVEVKIGNCITSSEGPYVVTGLENIDNEAVFSVFPNPTTGIVQVSIKAMTSPKVEIQNSLGQSLAKIEMKKEGFQYLGTYDFGSSSSGLYFVRIIDERTGIQTVRKVIKN